MGSFFTKSLQVQNIIKGFNLTKTLFVSSILIGEQHTGKKTLISYLFPNTPCVDGTNLNKVKQALEENDELIITHFDKITNQNELSFDNKRIIALADNVNSNRSIDELFAFIYHMPTLKERPDDIMYLTEHFKKEAKSILMIEDDIIIDTKNLDLSQNAKTLKKSIYKQIMKINISEDEIKTMLYQYFMDRLEGNNGYKEHLYLFEKPLIEAGLRKFGSQLQLSQVLGINRNTLRKKIYELDIH